MRLRASSLPPLDKGLSNERKHASNIHKVLREWESIAVGDVVDFSMYPFLNFSVEMGPSNEAIHVKGWGLIDFNQGGQCPILEITQENTEETEGGDGFSLCGLRSQVFPSNLETFNEGQFLVVAASHLD